MAAGGFDVDHEDRFGDRGAAGDEQPVAAKQLDASGGDGRNVAAGNGGERKAGGVEPFAGGEQGNLGPDRFADARVEVDFPESEGGGLTGEECGTPGENAQRS